MNNDRTDHVRNRPLPASLTRPLRLIISLLLLVAFASCGATEAPGTTVASDADERESDDSQNLVSSKNIPVFSRDIEYPDDHQPLDYEQTFIVESDGTTWKIGDEASPELRERQNVTVEERLIERSMPFGPIPGVKTQQVIAAWNNQDRILYIEALDSAVRTTDDLHIGMHRDDIIETIGTPQASGADFIRYLNLDIEPIWLVFHFDERGVASRMIVFLF